MFNNIKQIDVSSDSINTMIKTLQALTPIPTDAVALLVSVVAVFIHLNAKDRDEGYNEFCLMLKGILPDCDKLNFTMPPKEN